MAVAATYNYGGPDVPEFIMQRIALPPLSLSLVAFAVASLQSADAAPISSLPQAPVWRSDQPSVRAVSDGYKALASGDLATAEKLFRSALQLDGRSADAHVGVAELAMRRQQPAQAEKALKQALQIDPERAQTLYALGRWYSQQGRHIDAEESLRKAVQAQPKAVVFWVDLGQVQLWGLRNPKAAESSFRSAITADPQDPRAHLGLANALVGQQRTDDAAAAFEKAAQLAPTEPLPLLSLSRYHASRGQVDRALATLDRLIAAQPGAAQAYLEQGDLHLLKGDVAKAMQSFQRMVKSAPQDAAPGHLRMATLLQAQQKWTEAESAYRAAIAADPRFYAAYNNLAFMLAERRQNLGDAQSLAQKAVELEPEAPSSHDTLGWVLRAKGDLNGAVKWVSKAIAVNRHNPVYHYHLGILQAERGQTAEAERSLKRALDLDPKFRQADDARQRVAQLASKR